MVDLLGIISFFLLSLVVRKLVVGYLKDTNAGEWYLAKVQHTVQLDLGDTKGRGRSGLTHNNWCFGTRSLPEADIWLLTALS